MARQTRRRRVHPAQKGGYVAVQIEPGRWYAVGDYSMHECCDCALVHDESFKVENGRLWFKTERNERETTRLRKLRGIKVLRAKVPDRP